MNGTFTMVIGGTLCPFPSGGEDCGFWRRQGTYNNCCPCMLLYATKVGDDYITRLEINLGISIGGYVHVVTYEYNHGTSQPDCSAFSNLPLAFVSNPIFFNQICVGFPAATVLLSAIP
ncbi:MAG: hypothetical protein ACR2FY_15055 [Pirellulaceae bacterium]